MVKKINTTKRIILPKEIVKEVLDKIIHSECLNCGKDIEVSFKHSYKWKLPLCRDCRIIFLEEDMK